EAQRVDGRDFFCGLTFPVGDSPCTLILGGWGGTVVGLSSVDGLDASENETRTSMEFEAGQWYRILLRVTDREITAYVDDELVVPLENEGRWFSVCPGVTRSRHMGISMWRTPGALRVLRIRSLGPATCPDRLTVISPLISPDSLNVLSRMGHGDEIVFG